MSLRWIMDDKKGKRTGSESYTTTPKIVTWWKEKGCKKIRVGLFYAKKKVIDCILYQLTFVSVKLVKTRSLSYFVVLSLEG